MLGKKRFTGVVFTLFTFAALASLFTAPPLWAGDKVGFIDLQRLVRESRLGKAASADIDRLRAEKQGQIDEKIRTINQVKINLETNDALLRDEEKKERIEALNTLIKDYKRMVADAKEDIEKQDRDLVAQILKKADGALKKVAKNQGYTIILKDPNAIGYLDPDADITDPVLKALDRE